MPGFFKLLTAATLLGIAKAVEKTSDAIDDIKNNPPESMSDKVERYKREINGILKDGKPDFCNARRLETALVQLNKVQYFLSPFRQAKELEEVRETIDIYYRTVKVPTSQVE